MVHCSDAAGSLENVDPLKGMQEQSHCSDKLVTNSKILAILRGSVHQVTIGGEGECSAAAHSTAAAHLMQQQTHGV
jgi:hypothetical protein